MGGNAGLRGSGREAVIGPHMIDNPAWLLPICLWPISGYVVAAWLLRRRLFLMNMRDQARERPQPPKMEAPSSGDEAGEIVVDIGDLAFFTCLPVFAGPLLILAWLFPRHR